MSDSTHAIAQLPIAERLARIGWTEVLRVPELGVCWEWNGARHPQGYGQIHLRGRAHAAHRLALEDASGLIPDGLQACHRCDNPPCVNPAHLYAGTPSQNTVDFYERSGIERPRGEDHPMAKLTAESVAAIRATYAAGGITYRELAIAHGVGTEAIARIIRRETWT